MTSRLVRTGLLVVERIVYGDRCVAEGRRREPFGGVSAREVLERYMGIDGRPWPDDPAGAGIALERGLAPLAQDDRVRTYFRSLRPKTRCDLLVVERESGEAIFKPTDMKLLGYDFGFLESEYNVYSFLFHEIIYPRFDELGAFASRLNQHLLLDSAKQAKEIAEARNSLEGLGERFETSDSPEVCEPLAVFAIAE